MHCNQCACENYNVSVIIILIFFFRFYELVDELAKENLYIIDTQK